jgi:ribosomal protein S18 acetylase RimI-like enzyme
MDDPMNPAPDFTLVRVPPAEVASVIDVMCEAFAQYPVMRFVLGAEGDAGGDDAADARRLRRLVGFFVMARALRDEPLLGVAHDGGLVAAATVSFPGTVESPPELRELREQVWGDLGADARARYEAYGEACAPLEVDVPHAHLNMIGVRPAFQGRGLASRLLDEVHAISRAAPQSRGVMLMTESSRNVALYEHMGYQTVGYTRVGAGLETWGMFRPD